MKIESELETELFVTITESESGFQNIQYTRGMGFYRSAEMAKRHGTCWNMAKQQVYKATLTWEPIENLQTKGESPEREQ